MPPWRYIQREYAVRLLSDGFFGQDVTIPALTVTYNLQERGSGSQGRDQQYILPPLPMRILSLVPKSADDIRDASGQTFASIESRRCRASLATTTAWVSFAFAAVFGIFALVRATSQLRAKKKGIVKPLPEEAFTYGYQGEMKHFVECARDGRVPRETYEDGWIVNLVMDAGYQSIRTKAWVPVKY